MPALRKLNLQFFAIEDGGFGAYDPSTAYDGINVEPQSEGQGEVTQPVTDQQTPEQTQPELLDFGGRKLPANEDLTGLHKDFTEQQRYITALQEQVNAYKQITTMQQQAPQVQQQEPEISSNVEEWSEDTWQQFYDKPQDVIGSLIEREVQRLITDKVEPILQEREWNQEIQNMYDAYPDFEQYISDVQELVNQHPDRYADRPGGLEEAYFRAKALNAPDPASLVQNPEFLNQYVLPNQTIRQQFLNQYIGQKQQTNQQIPSIMGRNTSGMTPQTPDNAPQTLKEASRAFLKQLGQR